MRLFLPHGVCACKYGPAALQFSFFSAHSCGGYIRAGAVRYILEKALTHHTSVAQNLPPPTTAPETFKRSCGRFRINKSNSTFFTNSFLTTGHLIPACLFRLFHYQTIDPPSKLAATHQQYQTSISNININNGETSTSTTKNGLHVIKGCSARGRNYKRKTDAADRTLFRSHRTTVSRDRTDDYTELANKMLPKSWRSSSYTGHRIPISLPRRLSEHTPTIPDT